MSLPFNVIRARPQMKDLLDALKKDVFLTLNCHALATIETFDPIAQTVQASLNYQRTVSDDSGAQTNQNLSVMVDMPLISLCGGATSLTFPISQGDQALILFNDRDLSNWANGARSGSVASVRLHSFADGIALVGLNRVSSYDTVRALLSDGTVKLGINPSTHKVALGNGTTLLSILDALVSALNSAATDLQANPITEPAAAAAGIALSAALASIDFGEVLE